MDRLSQLREEAGCSGDSTLDTSSPPSETYITANESSSKYFTLSEVDSTFDISPTKDDTLASTTAEPDRSIADTERLISNLSPIGKKSDLLDSYKIGKQIEAATILSGGVNIFDDNDNSYDGDELVIDEKANTELKLSENLDLNFQKDDNLTETNLLDTETAIPSKDTEVVLQIDGKNVDAIDIGNGLYLYRKEGEEELAAVQIIDDDQQQPNFKFLKVRENAEGNLEVYEEIEIEVPKEVPAKEGNTVEKNSSHVPIKDINKVISDQSSNKVAERRTKTPQKETTTTTLTNKLESESGKDSQSDSKTEVNWNGKMMKVSDARKSPLIGSFTPMTYHSTPNKEGIPLTKTMVDQQLHPNRHSDNVKKTIEVHTDSSKQRLFETPTKNKDLSEDKISTKDKDVLDEKINLTSENNDISLNQKEDIKETDLKKDEIVENKQEIEESQETSQIEKESVTEEKLLPEKTLKEDVNKGVDSAKKEIDNINKEENIVVNTSEQEIKSPTKPQIIKSTEQNKPTVDETKMHDSINESVLDTTNTEGEIHTSIEKSVEINETPQEKPDEGIDISKEKSDKKCEDKNDNVNTQENENKGSKPDKEASKSAKEGSKSDNEVSKLDIEPSKPKNETSKSAFETSKTVINASKPVTEACKPIIDACKPVIEACKPVIEACKPVIEACKPIIETSKPGIETFKPDLGVSKPRIEASKPDIEASKPDIEASKPDIEASKPHIEVSKPDIEASKPDIEASKPDIEASKPDIEASELDIEASKPDNEASKSDKEIKQQEIEKTVNITTEKEEDKKQKEETKSTADSLVTELKSKDVDKIDKHDSENMNEKQEPPAVDNTIKENTKTISDAPVEVVTDQPLITEEKKEKDSITTCIEKSSTSSNIAHLEKSTANETKPVKETEIHSKLKELEKESLKEIKQPVGNVNVVQEIVSQKASDKAEKAEKSDIQTSDDKKEFKVVESKTPDPNKNETKSIESTVKSIEKIESNLTQNKGQSSDKQDVKKVPTNVDAKPKSINNNHAAVPFGKWTEANRQEFLNKIKEAKVPVNTSNANQIKQPNDLNRRDILKKIDSQRQSNNASSKVHDFANLHKLNVKKETTAFVNKNTVCQESKIPVKAEAPLLKNKPILNKKVVKQELAQKPQTEVLNTPATITNVAKKESIQRKEINNQDLIDKTIEGIINKAIPIKQNQEDSKQTQVKKKGDNQKNPTTQGVDAQSKNKPPSSLDDIEMKMNELHGIPFIERPPHELPQLHNHDSKTFMKPENQKIVVNKVNKIPNLLPLANKNQQKITKDNVVDVDSEEEIIEHEPITGDIDLVKINAPQTVPIKEKLPVVESVTKLKNNDTHKRAAIITENDFDKFARRNSITYEDCLTVNFDGKETHNVVQTVVEKEVIVKKYNRNEILLAEAKAKSPHKQTVRQNNHPNKDHTSSKFTIANEDTYNKTKLQIAYQSALTAKRQLECPITVIEDKPVKVLFMDSDTEFLPRQLNVQGQELSPAKKPGDYDAFTVSTCDSVDSDILDGVDDGKQQDETKTKTKHQRKQVLTPVDTPELELIEPSDLGIEVSPKKKRKMDDSKIEKLSKSLVPKKSYLLGRNTVTEEKLPKPQELIKNPSKETTVQSESLMGQKDAVSAIDNLVKAAELLETQSSNTLNANISSQTSSSQQNTPVKRGRGRPRKYPLPEGTPDKSPKMPIPQKKPRLIDAKVTKHDTSTEEDSTDDEIIKENWTMGKINENIVCPICNKLFRSENVVFKHVKHCTGPSPNRSDSDKRSPRRMRPSQEFETKSRESKSDDMDIETEKYSPKKDTPKKRKSKDSKSTTDSDDVIVIEDTPVKEKPEKCEEIKERKEHISRKTISKKFPYRTNSLMCEICGKIFRQLSYLVSHKLMHKKEDTDKHENDTQPTNKSIFSCEVCQKQFRKLHHLVQHRLIHNRSSAVSSRLLRKSSSDQSDTKTVHLKNHDLLKQTEDQSAGFRCEPCDKSFRKLHHLVEHRETHDGINRQKNITTTQTVVEKPVPPPQCDICNKTFRKLHHLIEHKEQHLETSSEKSDDKSVKSSLSARDIIHECPLCYMVFPNEHSLNKHTIICQKKKRQSTAKQAKQAEENQTEEETSETVKTEEDKIDDDDDPKLIIEEKVEPEKCDVEVQEMLSLPVPEKIEEVSLETREKEIEDIPLELESSPLEEEDIIVPEKPLVKSTPETNIASEILAKLKKMENKEVVKDQNAPKKKTSIKERPSLTGTKRKKSTTLPPPVDNKSPVESSDDDEIRYMFNPDYKAEDTTEYKVNVKDRANKRNSLQIERPNSKDLTKRRASLQHPPKIPRLKRKSIEIKNATTNQAALLKNVAKLSKLIVEPVPSTDSDDSDVKYSFPKVSEKTTRVLSQESTSKEVEKRQGSARKSLAEKRKTLGGIAKRKSLGKMVAARHKVTVSPMKQIKKRTEAEHRCDCGQLFSSAALLSRHTTLAHTPPRIRRRRSPPPPSPPPPPPPETAKTETKTNAKNTPRKLSITEKSRPSASRKSSVKSDASNTTKTIRKASANSDSKSNSDARKQKNAAKSEPTKIGSSVKPRRNTAHRGVPVPEKMRKMMEKFKK